MDIFPFSLFASKPNGVEPHNLELAKRLPESKVKAIQAQDARDAKMYDDIEQHCQDLRDVRSMIHERRRKKNGKG